MKVQSLVFKSIGIALGLSGFMSASAVLGENDLNPRFYGSIGAGLIQTSHDKIDTTDTDVANAVSRDGGTVSAKSESVLVVDPGYFGTNFGLEFNAGKNTKGVIEASAGCTESSSKEIKIRKYYLMTDMGGAGQFTFGRADTVFGEVAAAADAMSLAFTNPAGTFSPSRNFQMQYSTGALLGPAKIQFALAEPSVQSYGTESSGGVNFPAIHIKGSYSTPMVSAAAAVYTQKYALTKAGSTDDGEFDKYVDPKMYSINISGSFDKFSATYVLTTGDPIFTGLLQNAMIYDGLKDSVMGHTLWVAADMSPMKFGVFVGMASATLAKIEDGKGNAKAVDKDQVAKDTVESASAIGLHFDYVCQNELTWIAEVSMTERSYDSVKQKGMTQFGVGVVKSFGG